MKGFWATIIIFSAGASLFTQAYLYDVKVLRKWHPEFKRYHYWIGFSDFHDKAHKDNVFQRKKIEELLAQADPSQLFVLIEDLSSPNDCGRLGCGSYFINSRVGILASLGYFCAEKDIPFKNVEFRYCRVVALGPVINNINADPASFPSTRRMTINHLMQEIEQTYGDLLLANQKDRFKSAFLEKSRTITRAMDKLNLSHEQHKSIADYVATNSTPLNRLDMVKNLLTFDGILIGFKLVDSTLKAEQYEKVVAFAGGTHIAEAYDLLQKIDGWEPVTHHDVAEPKTPSVVKSIGATLFERGLSAKPHPISVELIEHYLKN